MPTSTRNPTRVAIFGATSAIASAVAQQLADDTGSQLVLVARDTTTLAAAATELKARGAAGCRTLQADFADTESLALVADAA